MAKGYWLIHIDITDPEQFKAYTAATPPVLKKFGARFLVRGGQFENPEGKTRSRNSIVEFPSYQAALDCYNSVDYQEAMRLRRSAATMDLVIIEGFDGPQPN